ncbi:hypothetical protein P2H44_20020 [Albimonas sp. CAU 1670]|uniref:hypothetical protein n=1 Tax=Albimonas sp. CAU 1670 TaxID=3032599 RepID=UPI0023DAD2CD|nr:hypothetical protein [Albimonas sp. CAU 1670]MDF2234854.1 hypothetical protein [Albimonas sp. CAU 1670]
MNVIPFAGAEARLARLAASAYAVATCNGSPTLYVEEPTFASIQTLRDAWATLVKVRRDRELARRAIEAARAPGGGDAA